MNTDYIYWTFTAAAQSVAAFVGLLLTGYALVHSLMESAQDKDDSLDDIHRALRVSIHRRLTVLAWLTTAAVVLSLLVVYINRSDHAAPGWSQALAALLDFLAIGAGLAFVVSIVDPRRFQKAAEQVLEDEAAAAHVSHQDQAPAADFLQLHAELERAARQLLLRQTVVAPGTERFPLRRLQDELLSQQLLSDDQALELKRLNRYRNLLVHGDAIGADPAMLTRARRMLSRLQGPAQSEHSPPAGTNPAKSAPPRPS